jgi:hypothetical protein
MRTRVAGSVQVLDSLTGISCTDSMPPRMKFIPYSRHPLIRFERTCTMFSARGNRRKRVGAVFSL